MMMMNGLMIFFPFLVLQVDIVLRMGVLNPQVCNHSHVMWKCVNKKGGQIMLSFQTTLVLLIYVIYS